MATTEFDAGEVLRRGLRDWWADQVVLEVLGTPTVTDDSGDGSPASSVEPGASIGHPYCAVRLGEAVLTAITNVGRFHDCDVTFEIYGKSAAEVALDAQPLTKLLGKMNDRMADLPDLPEGHVAGMRLGRFKRTQLQPTLWRAERECVFVVRLDRAAS